MAKTAVINKRRRRRTRRRRRRNTSPRAHGSAARTENRRRRRRRSRRRRNPVSVRKAYGSGGYRRRPNPDGLFDVQTLIDVTPAATGGVFAARWATKLAGEFEDGEPGFKHAIAIWIAAGLGGQIIGNILNDTQKGAYAMIAALGYGGDLFARKVFFKDADWIQENLYLGEYDEEENEESEVDGFQETSVLGQVYYDAAGNPWRLTEEGYVPYEMGQAPQLPSDPAVTHYGSQLAGFQETSVLGRRRTHAAVSNSFGYSE